MLLENLLNSPEYISGTKGDKSFVRLSSNESAYGPSPRVIKKAKEISKSLHTYPDSSYSSLKEALAEDNGVSTSNIILGNGSDEIFLNLFLMFLSPKENVVTIEKTFIYYKILSSIIGSKLLEAKRGENFSISCGNILELVNPSTKMIIFPSPDNPTGVIISRECIEKILRNIPETTLFVLDEAYFQFVPQNKYWNSIELVKKYPNFVVTRTFSKLYALAGLRIGYGICSENIAKLYEKMRMPFNVSLIASECAKVALKEREYYSRALKLILTNKKYLSSKLRALGMKILEESYGNFLFLQGPKDLDKRLFEKKVVIRNLESFGYEETYYRITVGTRRENVILVRSLREILRGGGNE